MSDKSKKGALYQITEQLPQPGIAYETTYHQYSENSPPPNGGFPVIPLILGGSILVCVCVWCYDRLHSM